MSTCASFFAGVGGIDKGFELCGADIVYANEFDEYAADTYDLNHEVCVHRADIHDVSADDIPQFDILLAGFPCQAFSIAGRRQGFDDEEGRGTLFFELVRLIEELQTMNREPQAIFLENVKNLASHDHGRTFHTIIEELRRLGYHVDDQAHVLNASQYGNIPQNRERTYIVAFLDEEKYHAFQWPQPVELTTQLQDIIDYDKRVDKSFYYGENCYFYQQLRENVHRHDTLYQWRRVYVRENQSGLCPTLTANMGMGGHNVPIVYTNYGEYRKLTPSECFHLQGYPGINLPEKMSRGRLYKQAGNSVVVPVVRRIAENMVKLLDDEDAE